MARPTAPTSALILAAGLGTRLMPLTRDRAKPALPVAGPTLIERIVARLAAAGITDLIVNLHYRPETITGILGDGTAHGVRVRYSWEMPLLGSGGGPRRAFALVEDDRLWLVNGDTLADVDLAAMATEHAGSGALVTMAVVPNPAPARYGGVVVDNAGGITGFVPRGHPDPTWHFVGTQIAERAAFQSLEDGVPAESVTGCYRQLIAAGRTQVRAFRSTAAFHDIGTPADYLATSLALAGSRVVRGAGAVVDATADLDQCVIGDGARIGRGVRLRRAIVGDGAVVPDRFEREGVTMLAGPSGLEVTPIL